MNVNKINLNNIGTVAFKGQERTERSQTQSLKDVFVKQSSEPAFQGTNNVAKKMISEPRKKLFEFAEVFRNNVEKITGSGEFSGLFKFGADVNKAIADLFKIDIFSKKLAEYLNPNAQNNFKEIKKSLLERNLDFERLFGSFDFSIKRFVEKFSLIKKYDKKGHLVSQITELKIKTPKQANVAEAVDNFKQKIEYNADGSVKTALSKLNGQKSSQIPVEQKPKGRLRNER